MSRRYDQLIADMRSDYRPQREWGEGRGILMVVGHFLVGVAGGTWVLASFFDVFAGMAVAWVLGALGAIAHLMFLGRPERAFKMIRHVRTSWISRGFVGLALLLSGGALYLTLAAWGLERQVVGVIAGMIAWLGAVIVIGYMGFCYTSSKAIPFWHSPLHPALYIAYAARGGLAVLLIIAAAQGRMASESLLHLWLVFTLVVALVLALEIQGALTSESIAARWSARDVLAGRLSRTFYGGTLALGLIVPLLLLLGVNAAGSSLVIALIGITSVAGDFFMKLSTVRAGVYRPMQFPRRQAI